MKRAVKQSLVAFIVVGVSSLTVYSYLQAGNSESHDPEMAAAPDAMVEDQERTAGARLLNFHSDARVPDRFVVYFKNERGLNLKQKTVVHQTLKDVLPLSDEASARLAQALVELHQGKLLGVYLPDQYGRRGFSVELSESKIRMMALDSRIDFIEAAIGTKGS
jgi:hypothetical protein